MVKEVEKFKRIQKLDVNVANQIAAGEVIERPANVIKELLENSLDACADNIKIEIKNYGSEYIKINDNGKGIFKDDLPLAVSAHATSKISSIEDLNSLYSFGFRGEALSSIASVSNFTLISKTINSDSAYQISNDLELMPASHNQGTSIIVENLFYNTPARKKFLKSAKTETQHITDIVNRVILSNFSVGFSFAVDNKHIYRFNIADNLDSKSSRLKKILGVQFIDNSKYFEDNQDEIKISGWLGNSSNHYGSSDKQYVFLNNRIVKDKLLSGAIKSIYEDRIPKGRYPGYVLFIEIEPSLVDVNVHPSKYEVRFQNSYYIYSVIRQKLVSILNDFDSLNKELEEPVTDYLEQIAINNQAVQNNNKKYNYKALDNLSKNSGNTKISCKENFVIPSSISNFEQNLDNQSSHIQQESGDNFKLEKINQDINPFFGEVIDSIDKEFILTKNTDTNKYYVFNIGNTYAFYTYLTINHKLDNDIKFSNFDLIVPFKTKLSSNNLDSKLFEFLLNLGIYAELEDDILKIKKIPDILKHADISEIGECVIKFLSDKDKSNFVQNLSSVSFGRLNKNFDISDKKELLYNTYKDKEVKKCMFNSWRELNRKSIAELF